MKPCGSGLSRQLSRGIYAAIIGILIFFLVLLLADYATAYTFFEQNLKLPVEYKIEPQNVQRLPIRGKVFGITYFADNSFYVFDALDAQKSKLKCGGFYRGTQPLPQTLHGYHQVDITYLGVELNCVPIKNKENWQPADTLMWNLATVFISLVLCFAAIITLICLFQDNWCRCRVANGLEFTTWC